jgi:NAD(P)-dependent dehydrogenase (short-subunit alcohol dehydrogenase family)
MTGRLAGKTDVTEEASVRPMAEEGAAWRGGLDVLCQNVGPQFAGPITDSRRHSDNRARARGG